MVNVHVHESNTRIIIEAKKCNYLGNYVHVCDKIIIHAIGVKK